MIIENQFEEVLSVPAINNNCRELFIISGYASAQMASSMMEFYHNAEVDVRMQLIIGMVARDGISEAQHNLFRNLEEQYDGNFFCSYICGNFPVHSKVYCWNHNDGQNQAFVGSNNFTQNGFFSRQVESIAQCDHIAARRFFDSLSPYSLRCSSEYIETRINFTTVTREVDRLPLIRTPQAGVIPPIQTGNLPSVNLSLLTRGGTIHEKGGLNWGQREGREPNQAYIPVPTDVQRSRFFPPPGQTFNLITDDGRSMLCKCAGTGGKNLESSLDNSELGRYFRRRIGVRDGEFVRASDLQRYGRTSVTIRRLSAETYSMDFAV